jgi:1,4-alpha-glucan branching enzyme
VEFVKHLNSIVHSRHPGTLVIAEESSAFPAVTHPLDRGGLGFDYKWNLGWMHDFLTYLSKEPVHRRYHQGLLTFEMSYAFSENFQLVWSHDEVVHGKGSLPRKMPGDDWQKFANARAGFAYLFAHPGKKLHFMGLEFGAWSEWDVKNQLDWALLAHKPHQGLQSLVRCLNAVYRDEPALHAKEHSWEGFQWIDFQDADHNILGFLRKGPVQGKPEGTWDILVCVFNFSPLPRHHYRIGVPYGGFYRELINTDSDLFGGSNLGNFGGRGTDSIPMHHFPYSLELTLPPLSAGIFKLGDYPKT